VRVRVRVRVGLGLARHELEVDVASTLSLCLANPNPDPNPNPNCHCSQDDIWLRSVVGGSINPLQCTIQIDTLTLTMSINTLIPRVYASCGERLIKKNGDMASGNLGARKTTTFSVPKCMG